MVLTSSLRLFCLPSFYMSSVLPVLLFLCWLALSLTFVSYTAHFDILLLWIYGDPLISEL